MSFFSWYFDLSGERAEEHVLCPFPHRAGNLEYFESHPSAQVNTEKKLFHCKTCGTGHNEASFIKAITGCTLANAHRLVPAFAGHDGVLQWDQERAQNTGTIPLADSFHIPAEIQQQLKLATSNGVDIAFPVFMYGRLLDVRTYTPNGSPKVRSRPGAINGLIIPFDIWKDTPKDRWTILAAGEKDMAVTRSHNLNAITLTGGEQMAPLMPEYFRDRLVAICYDNDEAGRSGAQKIANFLAKHGAYVKVITAFHAGMEHKEDLTDFFNKYSKTRDDLIQCIEATDFWVPTAEAQVQRVTLHEAALPHNTGKLLRANIQVVAVADAVFTMPTELIGTKTRASEEEAANTMRIGEQRTWVMDEDNIEDVLHLVDNGFKDKQLRENHLKLLRIPFKERNVDIRSFGKYTVYKAAVTDIFETASDSDYMPMEFQVYSINHRLESGKKYTATFKIVPHPYAGQQLIMIISNVEQAADAITGFSLTTEVKQLLDKFRSSTATLGVAGMINDCVQRFKGLLGYNGNNTLIETMDLAYHTPLEFHLGRFRNLRGYLDTLVVGESRMGKSSTAETLRKTYNLGMFVSLAGNSATIPGLIGGSNKVGTGYQTKAGLIPQNHKGLMIFEEFGKCKADIISELTDIRSSNEVRIARVSGALTLPAIVRMITLSNVKTLASKDIRSIASYPHGIAVITELVGSAEDIARYDIMLVLGDKGTSISDPYWVPMEPYTLEEYRARIRWIWSRTAEQIFISENVGHYIFTKANELNTQYDTHIKIFGTEAWKKLARVAIAIAGYTVSTDDYTNIIVTKEHVDYATEYMVRVYDNETFKLRQYVEHERKYATTDDHAVQLLQEIYTQAPGVVLHLEQEHKTSRNMLAAASGLTNDQINRVINQLIQGMFIKLSTNDITPTERFRLTTPRLSRNTVIRRVGEIHGVG